MDEEIYTVEDIFERDTPLTEDLLDNSDGFTLSPITMLRRYMAEKELKKQNEDFEEAAEDMSMGYMNGGGIGSMMQPKRGLVNGPGGYAGKLPGLTEYLATLGAPAINFGRGLLGYQDPVGTETMQNRMEEIEAGRNRGNVGYEEYGLTPSGGRMVGGLMDLAVNNPADFALAGSVGKYDFSPEGRTGLNYDFTPDQDTGSTGSAMLDYVNSGGVKNSLSNLKDSFSNMGSAQASEIDISSLPPSAALAAALGSTGSSTTGRPNMRDIAGEELGFNINNLGNPTNDSRVVSEELGSTGFERPNMRDIAGEVSTSIPNSAALAATLGSMGRPTSSRPTMADIANSPAFIDDSIQVQDLSPSARIRSGFKGPGGSDDMGRLARTVNSTIGATPNIKSFPGVTTFDGPLSRIANPEIFDSYGASVDDPQVGDPGFEGYTPSFDKKELSGLAGLIDSLKGYDFKDALSLANLGTGAVGSKLAGSLNLPGYLGSLGLNALRKKTGNFGFDKIKKNTTTAVKKDKKIASDRKDELSRRQAIADAQKAKGQTTSGGGGNYRSDRDNSRSGGYGGSSRSSRENRSSDLGFSDIRLKDNIELVGKSPSDINIYNFTYLNNPKVYQGVMAHEVPWASVKHDNGYLMVDYNKVDVEFKIVH